MTFGDFVVSCLPIARYEARALARSVWVTEEDAVQDAVVGLLENEATFDRKGQHLSLARIVIRRRLQRLHIERMFAAKRGAAKTIPLAYLDDDHAGSVPSHEEAVEARSVLTWARAQPWFADEMAKAKASLCVNGHERAIAGKTSRGECRACNRERGRLWDGRKDKRGRAA